MPNIPDATLQEMLKQLPKETQKSLAHIVAGKITYQVVCLSDTCKGEPIAYLYVDGTDSLGRPAYRIEPVVRPDQIMKLRASRKRLDGQYGFQCCCGNDSRLARQELGHIGFDGLPPTREGLEAIYEALQKNPASYPEVGGSKEVDGFRTERLGV